MKNPNFFLVTIFVATPGVLHYKNGNMTADVTQLIEDPSTITNNFLSLWRSQDCELSSLYETTTNRAASSRQKTLRAQEWHRVPYEFLGSQHFFRTAGKFKIHSPTMKEISTQEVRASREGAIFFFFIVSLNHSQTVLGSTFLPVLY